MDIVKLIFDLLGGLAGPLYKLIKAELDGGATAEELRDKKWELYVSCSGGEGESVVKQREIEDEMANPDAD